MPQHEAVPARPAPARPWVDELLTRLLAAFTIAVSVAVSGAMLLAARDARAQEPSVDPSDAKSGTLLLRDRAGATLTAPLLATDVRIRVSGMVARAEVRQTFSNPCGEWLEGVYVFPLPENAAVDHLRMRLGERALEGEIRDRGEAQRVYTSARAAGNRAALLEQERPNVFTSSVANVGPNERVTVEIEYEQTLRYQALADGGARWSLRFPTVIGPRYVPAGRLSDLRDAARVTPPVLPPRRDEPPVNPVTIRVELDAGVPIATIDSPYHKIAVQTLDERRAVIELADGATPATRDFELVWTPVLAQAPRAAWFTERRGGRSYGLLMLMPPTAPPTLNGKEVERLPREAIFVIDTSGSMYGTSISQAIEALEMAIDRLAPGDRFNVIEFNSSARALFPDARPATRDNRATARGWVRALRAQGGTEMAKALGLALNGREDPARVRQVVFLTDGQVGNEDELFRLIAGKLGDSRLFTVGIGSAPNSHFMTQAAKEGRGTFTYIGRIGEVRDKMAELFAKLESPVLSGIRIDWPDAAGVESWPARIPDLYSGEPVVVTAALDRLEGVARVSGVRGAASWRAEIALGPKGPSAGSEAAGVGILWARDKIAALAEAMNTNRTPEARAEIVKLALAHHLVTRYTSLVAVDRTPARPANEDLKTMAIPTNLPEGQSYEAIFGPAIGELPRGATDSRLHIAVGLAFMLCALLLNVVRWMTGGPIDPRRRVRNRESPSPLSSADSSASASFYAA
ncbi:MAG TPA: marine proteobacterial sortase target protein [Burkholderiales bacterium]|nr:marine proteobacterial sortase target protein [Burkholderiales bacterium]